MCTYLIADAMYQIIHDTLSHHQKRLSSYMIQEDHTRNIQIMGGFVVTSMLFKFYRSYVSLSKIRILIDSPDEVVAHNLYPLLKPTHPIHRNTDPGQIFLRININSIMRLHSEVEGQLIHLGLLSAHPVATM